ncbi:unnamed protein product [Cyprideis torosa]|uniref:Uncharacterized protein n=1 Tax=Cyprideis torosa TaxID=163714 RepID=A0A7R8W762_9CRUS|nr:unnamed protein product [Cyprideis torosa]CAG0882063.1 unnamed protein product [Cyprideis torosa]
MIPCHSLRGQTFRIPLIQTLWCTHSGIHTSPALCKVTAGRHSPTRYRTKALTYEQAFPPNYITVTRGWNSVNTSNLHEAPRAGLTLVDDLFIRKFITGTFAGLVLGEVIIKRQFNLIRIAFLCFSGIDPQKIYFLIGSFLSRYTEELLSYWFQCPTKIEIQMTTDRKSIVYKYK